ADEPGDRRLAARPRLAQFHAGGDQDDAAEAVAERAASRGIRHRPAAGLARWRRDRQPRQRAAGRRQPLPRLGVGALSGKRCSSFSEFSCSSTILEEREEDLLWGPDPTEQ